MPVDRAAVVQTLRRNDFLVSGLVSTRLQNLTQPTFTSPDGRHRLTDALTHSPRVRGNPPVPSAGHRDRLLTLPGFIRCLLEE
jgi:hypothetical protein